MLPTQDLILGTAGHIDHGKTALVRVLTGIDTDRLPDEKLRGITIDLGFAALELGETRLAIVDVPGHERFIRNMLAGATGLDLAMLVIAADDGVMPQTREHLEILRLLGLSGGLIVLTKCDAADPSWIDLVADEVRELARGTFLEGADILRCSSITGEGIDTLKHSLGRLVARCPPRPDAGPFRMAIDRAFTLPGFGAVVTGTVMSGRIAVGDEVEWLPRRQILRVRGLHRHDRPADWVAKGMRAAINVVGAHHSEIVRGQELAAPGYLVPTRVLGVEITASADAARGLKHRARYRLHLGTAEVLATLTLTNRSRLDPGEATLGQLLTESEVVAVSGQPFILREESPPATLGGGRIVQPTGPRARRRDGAAIARLGRLASPDTVTRMIAAIEGFGLSPWTDVQICREAGVPISDVPARLSELLATAEVVRISVGHGRTLRLARPIVDAFEDRILRALDRLHQRNPRQSAIPRTSLKGELPDVDDARLVDALIDRLAHRKAVTADGGTVAIASFEPALSQAERKLKAEIHAALRDGGFSPPDAADFAARAGARSKVVPELLTLLVEEGRIVEIAPGLYLDGECRRSMLELVRVRLAGEATMTMSHLRDLLGTSRKYAVPIGEYLDRIGLTRRDGDVRRLGSTGEGVANG